MNNIYSFAGGLGTFLTIILDIIILRDILTSNRDIAMKIVWTILILTLPILGVIVYLLFADRQKHSGYEAVV